MIDGATKELPDVLFLADVTPSEAHRVGAKAANLAELARAGFPVPDGFVLTTAAFERFLQANGLGAGSSTEEVEAAPLPSEVTTALARAAAQYGDVPLAVRSSGIAEDRADASFAGQYETVLDVRGADALTRAVRRCWASAFSRRVVDYRSHLPRHAERLAAMAVLVQHQVPADAAGVAFTANPVTGDRAEIVVSAVRGLGERLVSGQAAPDEWLVRGDQAICRAAPEGAVDAAQVRAVAELARRVEAHFGQPQDVEWAIAGGNLFLLQARPITALSKPGDWKAPLPGAWGRNFRLGEWLGDPVTPLFASWLLPRLEDQLYANYQRIAGFPPRPPHHVIVNGWYFASWNFMPDSPAKVLLWMLRYFLPRFLIHPRRTSVALPPLAGLGVESYVRDWREKLLPRYQTVVARGTDSVDHLTPSELINLVDEVGDVAGDYFTSITSVGGFAWKSELPLATFYRQHLQPRIGGSHQRLLRGLVTPSTHPHAVSGLDWVHPTLGEYDPAGAALDSHAAERRAHLEADRKSAESEVQVALADQPKRLARFERLLATAQRFVPIREEQVAYFTLGWPLLRRAVFRLGTHLREGSTINADQDVFFLTRDELLTAVHARKPATSIDPLVEERRRAWERQRRLVPPLLLGELNPMVKQIVTPIEEAFGPSGADVASLRGLPASPGRATGPVRIIRRVVDLPRLQDGDVLVAPATTPAWTPLFTRAAAVVTDIGSPIAHASLIAREYGIPAVVGTGNATTRLSDGQIVTVDGNAGLIEEMA